MLITFKFDNPDDLLVFRAIADVVSNYAKLCAAHKCILLFFVLTMKSYDFKVTSLVILIAEDLKNSYESLFLFYLFDNFLLSFRYEFILPDFG